MNEYFRGTELGIGTSPTAAKMAALFFDQIVFPLPKYSFHKSEVPTEIVHRLQIDDVGPANYLPFALIQRSSPGSSVSTWEWPAHYIHKALAERGKSCVPVYTDPNALKDVNAKGGQTAVLEFKVLQAPVIDVANLQWSNIMEIRSDEESRKKLRRFRLMLHQDFDGKSAAFIQDSLLTQLDDYRNACKKHGLGLISTITSELLSSNSLLTSAGMALAAILTGDPKLAAIGAAPLTVEIGKIAIEITKHELNADQPSDNPIAWLADTVTQAQSNA